MHLTGYQDLQVLHHYRLPNRTTLIPYADEAQALRGPRSASPYWMDLNGEWAFHLYKGPAWLPETVDGAELDSRIMVPGCWQMQGFGYPQYTNAAYPIPYDPPYVPDENDIGWYSRTFRTPAAFAGRKTRIRVEGADSAFYVFVNGVEKGFSKCPHMPAEFDISDVLTDGDNRLDILVLRFSDGTYLEDQDQWRMSGIFRNVMLISMADSHIEDVRAIAGYDHVTGVGCLTAEADAVNCEDVTFCLLDGRKEVARETVKAENGTAVWNMRVADACPWSAEDPHRYTLLCSVPGQTEKVMVGFRTIEVKNRQFYVNGVSIKLKGVNRHDTHPILGHYVTPADMLKDVLLMKQHNLNTVRTSHYPNDPAFLDLCDEYGLYVLDETDLECHGVNHLGNYHLLSTDPEWHTQFVDRIVRMVMRDRNHPCIIMWSLGNEAGYGPNHEAMAAAARAIDPTRPIHYHSHLMFWNADASDIASYMYTDFNSIDEYLATDNPRPYFLCEYVHAMGQGPGGLEDYWQKIYSTDAFIGGCAWEWADHACVKMKDGKPFYAYGGDFGEYPHSHHFCVDALVYPDRTPHTGLMEYSNVLRPVRAEMVSETEGTLQVKNLYAFTGLDTLMAEWRIVCGKETIAQGSFETDTLPGETGIVTLPLGEYPAGSLLNIDWMLKKDTNWAKRGFVVAAEQFELQNGSAQPKVERSIRAASAPAVCRQGYDVTVKGDDFTIVIGHTGLSKWVRGGVDMISSPFSVNLWRAPTDNDRRNVQNWDKLGINRLLCRHVSTDVTEADKCVTVKMVTVHAPLSAQAILRLTQVYVITADGECDLTLTYEPLLPDMPFIPRIGFRFEMPGSFKSLDYQGRGPIENYPDKKTAARLGRYSSTVSGNHEPYVFPQENGAHMDCSFVRLLNEYGMGLEISGEKFGFNAHHYRQEMLEAAQHTYDVVEGDLTEVCIDGEMGPLGSASCGPQPFEWHRLYLNKVKTYHFTFRTVDAWEEC